MRIVMMAQKRLMLYALLIGAFASASVLNAEAFRVVNLSGTVLLKRGEGGERALQNGEGLAPGDRVRVPKASSLIIEDGSGFYKLHPFSLARIEKIPILVYGKVQKSSVSVFETVGFTLSPRPAQGKTVRVLMRSSGTVQGITASISDKKGDSSPLRFFAVGDGGYRALAGFDVEARVGRYVLRMRLEGGNGDFTEILHPFYLKASAFERGRVYLPENTYELLEPSEEKIEEREILLQVLSAAGSEAHWNFTFGYPVEEPEILSAFGRIRVYYMNGKAAFTRYHRGIDLRGQLGDSMVAPNSGVVAFAGMRITTGNTIVIDHGQGVFSLFFHLNALLVDAGAYVVKGQHIGEIGATGIAEGAHLHWGMFVNGIYVDPMDWVKRVF